MGTPSKPPGKAMYVAPRTDWDWLRIEQRKLYTRSEQHVDYVFRKLWGLITDPRNLRMALARVAGNHAQIDAVAFITRMCPRNVAQQSPMRTHTVPISRHGQCNIVIWDATRSAGIIVGQWV